ncbi:MAG: PPC domain-containing DNA-binding protein [Rariglobus sp.]
MKDKTLTQHGGTLRALIFETGDEVMSSLKKLARSENIRAARISGIGAFRKATIAYFDWEKKEYINIHVNEQVEVLVFMGDLAWNGDEPVPHIHVVLGKRDGSTIGGHLVEATVRPTLELMLTQAGALERRHDPASGLALIALET